jgi:hypothetical protein
VVSLFDGNMRSKWNGKKENISVVPSHNLLILEDAARSQKISWKKKPSIIMRCYYYEKKSEIFILEKSEEFDVIIAVFRKQLLICEISNLRCPVKVAVEYLKRLSSLSKFLKELKIRNEFEPMQMP